MDHYYCYICIAVIQNSNFVAAQGMVQETGVRGAWHSKHQLTSSTTPQVTSSLNAQHAKIILSQILTCLTTYGSVRSLRQKACTKTKRPSRAAACQQQARRKDGWAAHGRPVSLSTPKHNTRVVCPSYRTMRHTCCWWQVGMLKMIRNLAFAHRSQHVQHGRFNTEEEVRDPKPTSVARV